MTALAEPQDVTEVAEGVILRPMLTLIDATDLFLGDLERRGYSRRTVTTYRRILDRLADDHPRRHDVAKLTTDDVRRFLNHWNGRKQRGQGGYAQGTRAHAESVLSSFFKWLYHNEQIKRNPMDRLPRTRRLNPQDLDVVTVSSEDVRRLLEKAEGFTERLAVAVPAYTGARRRAAANLRLRDYDRNAGKLRFYEKGGKTIWKAVPGRLREMLDAAIAAGEIVEPDDYLIPPEGPLIHKDSRDDRVVWKVVKRVADRAGVDAHVHSLRGAFSVFYLENGGTVHGLQTLLGHTSIRTTETYLRRLDREQAMESVRDLDWFQDGQHPSPDSAANSGNPQSSLVPSGGGRIRTSVG